MTKVDFYTGTPDKLRTVCQLCQKALRNGLRVIVSTPETDLLQRLDSLMWQHPLTGFIPHCRPDDEEAEHTPVLLVTEEQRFPHHELLISLHPNTPGYFSRFDRVIEIVGVDETDSAQGRNRFKFYRDRGYELRHFDLSKQTQA